MTSNDTLRMGRAQRQGLKYFTLVSMPLLIAFGMGWTMAESRKHRRGIVILGVIVLAVAYYMFVIRGKKYDEEHGTKQNKATE